MITDIIYLVKWPLTLLIILWIFRRPISSLLPSIQKIKFQGAKIEFSKSLQQTSDDILENSNADIDRAAADLEKRDALTSTPEQTVLEAWNAIEQSAKAKVECLLPADEKFNNPLERPLDYLEFKGALTPTIANAIRDLRSLRNQVVQFGADLVVREDADQYSMLTTSIVNNIDGIAELPTVKLTALTRLILEVNSLVDSGNFDDITIEEVYDWMKTQSILPSLAKRARGHVFLDDYAPDGPYWNFAQYFHAEMESMYNAYSGDHARKWGVENRGLCLLLACTNELIQLGSGWHPNKM